ncbi:MAG: response regulator [Planctomycetia bacterium]|nr:response regulator [Planctomycetia bacterium]
MILVVDDDRNLVDVLTKRCEGLGLDVITAFDAWEALLAAGRQAPDLVFLDVNMPCGGGLSICELFAADVRLSSVPVIILTGAANQQTMRRCHDLCAYYVEKCAEVWPRLESLIRELLDLPAVDPNAGADETAEKPLGQRPSSAINTL